MAQPSRTEFEVFIKELGYAEAEVYENDPCAHADRGRCRVYFMHTAECCAEEPTTYGDLAWQVYRGCEACCIGLVGVLGCGGMCEHIRVFDGEADVTLVDTWEIPAADELLPVYEE